MFWIARHDGGDGDDNVGPERMSFAVAEAYIQTHSPHIRDTEKDRGVASIQDGSFVQCRALAQPQVDKRIDHELHLMRIVL